MLLDLLPLLGFVLFFYLKDLYWAVAVAMVLGLLASAVVWVRARTLTHMQWIQLGLLLVLGGLTLWLRDDRFIKWKPTAVYLAMAGGLWATHFWWGKHLAMQRLLGAHLSLPRSIWWHVNVSWILFFVGMALLNGLVVLSCSTAIWVRFKLVAGLVLPVLFWLGQLWCLKPYWSAVPENKAPHR